MTERKELEAYPETNLSNQLLQHHHEMLQFLFFTNYDIIYETFQLKHGAYSERNRGHVIQSYKSQEIAKHYQVMSQKMHIRLLRDDINLDKELGKLQILWHNRNIPFFHRCYFLKFLFTTYFKNIPALIIQESELIQNQQHIYYSIFKSISAREACIRNIKKQLANLKPDDVYQYLHVAKERFHSDKIKSQRQKYKAQGYKLKIMAETKESKISKTKFQLFSDSFGHLTKLTLFSIELIVKWKEYIAALTHDIKKQRERMQYYFYDDNYLLKVLSDIGFLRVSFLQQFYDFAPKNDPFMLECILAFQKRKEKRIEDELLKNIFMPQKQHLADIMTKLEYLSDEYRHNIRSRKVFDINILKKPLQRSQQKYTNNEQKEIAFNKALKTIGTPTPAKKSKSVATFRIRDKTSPINTNDKIVVEFNKKDSPLRKKLDSLPGSLEKHFLETDKDSPLKNSFIWQKNESSVKNSLVDMNLLNMLKSEVIKKVKQDFSLRNFGNKTQNEALELYIDNKVKQTMKTIFPFQPEKNIKPNIEFTPIYIDEANIGLQIELMFKKSIFQYRQMQADQSELIKMMQQSEYTYIIVGKIGQQQIGRAICVLDKDTTEFKILKILYLHFIDLSEIQVLITQIVEFLWKYENSYEIHFHFFQPSNNDAIHHLIAGLQTVLQKSCIIGRKQLYSTVVEVKIMFKRPHKNVNYIPNFHPFSFRLQFSMLFSHKKVMLQNKNQLKHIELLNYDYLLMQTMKRFITSQDIMLLKQKITWKNRLKMIVDMINEEGEKDIISEDIHQIKANNISDLNIDLTRLHQPFLEVSDLTKNNHVNLLTQHFTLTPNYPVKSIQLEDNQHFYRIAINSKVSIDVDETATEFYFLQAKQTQKYKLLVFNATPYLSLSKDTQNWLSMYLSQRISQGLCGMSKLVKEVSNLWIPMSRYPEKYKQRESMFHHTIRVLDLAPLKADLLIGQKLEWFCNMQMKNSIKYKMNSFDIMLQPPYGVAVVAIPSKTIIYSRIFI